MSKLVWDEWNEEHIKKHNVTKEQVEEAYKNRLVELKSYAGRIAYLGETQNKRKITIIISFEKQKEPYVVSARDMSRKERRIYEKNKK